MGWVSRDSFMNSTRPICAASYPSRVWVLCCVMTQGPACKTVAGRTSPLSIEELRHPDFLAQNSGYFRHFILLPSLLDIGRYWLGDRSSSS